MGNPRGRKRYRSQSAKPLNKSFALGDPRGHPGVLIMCDDNREKRASFELSDWLNEIIDDLAVVSTNTASDIAESNRGESEKKAFRSIEDELQAELVELTGMDAHGRSDQKDISKDTLEEKFKAKKVKFVEIGVRGMGLLWINDNSVDIVSILHGIYEEAKNSHQFRTRCSSRIIPLQTITAPALSSIEEALLQLVNESNKDESFTFKVEFRSRNSAAITRAEIYNLVHKVLGPKATVSLTNPDKIILIEGVKSFAGLSILPGWAWEKYHRYNIRNTAETEEQRAFRLEKAAEQAEKRAKEREECGTIDDATIAALLGPNKQVWVPPSKKDS